MHKMGHVFQGHILGIIYVGQIVPAKSGIRTEVANFGLPISMANSGISLPKWQNLPVSYVRRNPYGEFAECCTI